MVSPSSSFTPLCLPHSASAQLPDAPPHLGPLLLPPLSFSVPTHSKASLSLDNHHHPFKEAFIWIPHPLPPKLSAPSSTTLSPFSGLWDLQDREQSCCPQHWSLHRPHYKFYQDLLFQGTLGSCVESQLYFINRVFFYLLASFFLLSSVSDK